MNKRLTLRVAMLLAIFFAAMPTARAADTPFLTWEAGKQQTIVIGATTSPLNWKIELIGENAKPLEFKGSLGTRKNFYIFSINLPNNLPVGSYVVQSTKPAGTKTIIAAVNVVARTNYTITQIPTDLILLLILFILITSSLSVLRGRNYSSLTFNRRLTLETSNPLYGFRSKRLSSTGDSFARYIAHRDGEWLHFLSPITWSLTPFIGIIFGGYVGFSLHNGGNFPQASIPLLLVAAVFGALDATLGYALAIGFTFATIAFGDITSLRDFLAVAAFSMAWIAPAMLSSMYLLTLSSDYIREIKNTSFARIITIFTSSILGASTIVLSAILTDSLAVTRQMDSFFRWPLAGVIAVILLIKSSITDSFSSGKELREEKLALARVVSPGVAYSLTGAIFGVIYVWSKSFTVSAIATLIIALPYYLIFIAFPGFPGRKLARLRRSVLVEAALVGGLTYLVYFAVQSYPAETIQKSEAFILLGLIPVLLHAIFSLLHASAEIATKEEMNAQS